MNIEYKYFLSNCLLIRNENHILLQNLKYNSEAGIEHFYIMDNNSDVPVEDYLKQHAPGLLNKCTIERVTENHKRGTILQDEVYQYCLHKYGHETRWLSFTDTDEIFKGDLKKLCDNAESNNKYCVRFLELCHGGNGHIVQPNYESQDLFDLYGNNIVGGVIMFKNIVRTQYAFKPGPHRVMLWAPNVLTLDTTAEVKLHHFMFKSFEEYVKKVIKGCVSGRVCSYNIGEWLKYNKIEKLTPEMNEILQKYNYNELKQKMGRYFGLYNADVYKENLEGIN